MSEVQVTGLREIVAELDKATSRALPEVTAVVVKGALNIKQDAARRASGLKHAPAYPRSINYDLFHTPGHVQAEIGPDKGKRQGSLGNLIEFGSVNNSPRPHLNPAADAEEPRYGAAMEALTAKLLP